MRHDKVELVSFLPLRLARALVALCPSKDFQMSDTAQQIRRHNRGPATVYPARSLETPGLFSILARVLRQRVSRPPAQPHLWATRSAYCGGHPKRELGKPLHPTPLIAETIR